MDIKDPLNLKEIGMRIRLEREKLDLSREKFAEIIDLSPFYIGQIERGDRNMSIDTLMKISNSLNVSIDYILKGEILYMENIYAKEVIDSNYKDDMDGEIKDLLHLLSGLSKVEIKMIQDIIKLILPHLSK